MAMTTSRSEPVAPHVRPGEGAFFGALNSAAGDENARAIVTIGPQSLERATKPPTDTDWVKTGSKRRDGRRG
jgi:hypothetical protein